MNEITYTLCQKPIIGIVMYITSLCAFPPLFTNVPVDLAASSVAPVEHKFSAPVSKSYALELVLSYSSPLKPLNEFLGEYRSLDCQRKFASEQEAKAAVSKTGTATPFEIVIRSASTAHPEQRFYVAGSCGSAWWASGAVGRTLALTHLEKGEYSIKIRPVERVALPVGVHAAIQLTAGYGK